MKTIPLLLAAILGCTSASAADIPVEVHVNLAHPSVPANKKHTNYLKVGIRGLEQKEKPSRPPVNVAVVLDRSGSMGGEKMENAKRAAKEALDRLGGDDIVSIVTFASTAETVVPATKLVHRGDILAAIDRIHAGGSTALFAGVSRAAEELRKFKTPRQVNRIVLLSDGQANVGPASVDDLARLGVSFAKESISVSTVGLGLDYNERLMARIAQTSDGTHSFVTKPTELAALFTEEFGDILSVVAQDIRIRIQCPEGVRPVRVLGRDAEIRNGVVEVSMNQLRAGQEKYALLEVETPQGSVNSDQLVCDVAVSYRLNAEDKPASVTSKAVAHRVAKESDMMATENKLILVEVAKQIGAEKQMLAVQLSDEGKIKEAEKMFLENAQTLKSQGRMLGSDDLIIQGGQNFTLNVGNNLQGTTWQNLKRAGQVVANGLSTNNASSNVIANNTALLNLNGVNSVTPSPSPSLPTINITSDTTIKFSDSTKQPSLLDTVTPKVDKDALKLQPAAKP